MTGPLGDSINDTFTYISHKQVNAIYRICDKISVISRLP